jgi:MFS transporter, MCT family, solute carrier family 16 (monocarboxylic acid transporters), member 14
MILLCAVFALVYVPIKPTIVCDSKDEEEEPEKKPFVSDGLPSPAFTKPLQEGRFAYSVPNSSECAYSDVKITLIINIINIIGHNTWMGTANNTTYPTAAEVFK